MTVRVGNATNTVPAPPPIPAAAGAAGKSSDVGTLNANFDQFLTLLTTQLKNQDPLSPMDSTQFTNQLVSFSGVEQQIKTNANLEKLLAAGNASQTNLGLSYIGLNVPISGNQFNYPGDGSVKMGYSLAANAASTTINILDKDGHIVRTQPGETSSGPHSFVWDGKNQTGTAAPEGDYTIQIIAKDQNQVTITTTAAVPGYVIGVQTGMNGEIELIIRGGAGLAIPLSSVTAATL